MKKDHNDELTFLKRPHFILLDGLRGIAALIIVIFHYLEMIYVNDYESNWLGHGYLAVDFFFCLSGFVIAYSYDMRIAKIGVSAFFTNRIIRLHPLVIVGTLIGLTGYLLNPFVADVASSGYLKIMLAALLSFLLLPYPYIDYRGGGLFPFNTPSWSLFLEYIANLIYALVLSRVRRSAVLFLCVIAAAFLVIRAGKAGWLIGGWDVFSIPDGFARLSFSFLAGLLIARYNLIIYNKLRSLVLCLLFILIFFIPHQTNDWLVECIIVIILFPCCLSLSAGASVNGRLAHLFTFIGELSYPLYMTHITSVWLFGDYYSHHHLGTAKLCVCVGMLVVFNLLTAYLIMRWIDIPLRNRLKSIQKNTLNHLFFQNRNK